MNHPLEILETVKIVTADGFAIINKSDLKPEHVLFGVEPEQSEQPQPPRRGRPPKSAGIQGGAE